MQPDPSTDQGNLGVLPLLGLIALALGLGGIGLNGCLGPQIAVSATTHHVGGSEMAWSFQVWNSGQGTLDFTVTSDRGWASVAPATGSSVGADNKVTVNVTFDRSKQDATQTAKIVVAAAECDKCLEVEPVTITLTMDPNYFTQQFTTGFSLGNTSITWCPNPGGQSEYTQLTEAAVDFPVDPTGGTVVDLCAGEVEWPLPLGGPVFPFYGVNYGSVFITPAGYVSPVAGTTAPATLEAWFAAARIAGLTTGACGGTVSVLTLADRVVVTFENVPTTDNAAGDNCFQIELFYDGTIRVTYLDMDAGATIAGLSYGGGGGALPTGFVQSNLSESYNTPEVKAAL